MRYVIIRDDDTNAFTSWECLERLYRPFLDRGLPVNLATIPAVSKSARMADGRPEGFLPAKGTGNAVSAATHGDRPFNASPPSEHVPLAENHRLVRYLRDNPGFKIVQHGCHHDYLEFDCADPVEVCRRLDAGKGYLQEAGFETGDTFVAPYDRLSRPALREVAARFRILSTGWYELKRLPYTWWPGYALKKLRHRPHWRVRSTLLLSHPGCLLSCHRAHSMGGISQYVETHQLTVLVTHWWEYFREGKPDEEFIDFLHETARYLATCPGLKVVSFGDLVREELPLN